MSGVEIAPIMQVYAFTYCLRAVWISFKDRAHQQTKISLTDIFFSLLHYIYSSKKDKASTKMNLSPKPKFKLFALLQSSG